MNDSPHVARRLRSDEQVDVVRHQDVGVDRQADRRRDVPQRRQVALPVGVVDEDRATVVAALDNVVWVASNGEAGKACHGIFLDDGLSLIGI